MDEPGQEEVSNPLQVEGGDQGFSEKLLLPGGHEEYAGLHL